MSINAIQVNDILMGGFLNGLESIAARNEQRAQIALETSLNGQLNEWKAYAGRLEKVVDAYSIKVKVLTHDFEGLKEDLERSNTTHKVLQKNLVEKLVKLNNALKRQSANAYAIGKMRDRLVEELAEVLSGTDLGDPEKRLAMHDADFQDFMERNTVKANSTPLPPHLL